MFGKFVSNLFNAARQITPLCLERQIHTGLQGSIMKNLCSSGMNDIAGGSWALVPVRNKVRDHFPYPKEHIRITRHGWAKRMSTPGGRRTLMRRILKGRYVLSH